MRHYVHCYALHCLDKEKSNFLRKLYKERGENVGAWRQACYYPLVEMARANGWDTEGVFVRNEKLRIWYVPTKLRQLCHLEKSKDSDSCSYEQVYTYIHNLFHPFDNNVFYGYAQLIFHKCATIRDDQVLLNQWSCLVIVSSERTVKQLLLPYHIKGCIWSMYSALCCMNMHLIMPIKKRLCHMNSFLIDMLYIAKIDNCTGGFNYVFVQQ